MLISGFSYDYSFLLSLTIGIFFWQVDLWKRLQFFLLLFSLFIADLANVNYFFQFSFNSKVVYKAHRKQNKFSRKIINKKCFISYFLLILVSNSSVDDFQMQSFRFERSWKRWFIFSKIYSSSFCAQEKKQWENGNGNRKCKRVKN